MPGGQGKIPQRAIRIDDATWQAAQRHAQERGETVTDVVRRALRRYAKR
jgi:antitoxin component of RelBE/YafQ-DinJ toxin-antitoxin module